MGNQSKGLKAGHTGHKHKKKVYRNGYLMSTLSQHYYIHYDYGFYVPCSFLSFTRMGFLLSIKVYVIFCQRLDIIFFILYIIRIAKLKIVLYHLQNLCPHYIF